MKLWKTVSLILLLIVVVAAAFGIAPVEFAAVPPQQSKTQTPTGVVSDSTCGAAHNMKNMTPAECTRACAKKGGYALVVGKDVYALKGHEAELDKLAAEPVTVRGTLSGKTLSVESVAPARKG